MDDFNNDYGYNSSGSGGGYDTGYDSGYDSTYTYEPDPVPDFSIDPMAFVPGAILDSSKPGWGASLAIQQGVEMMAQQMAQQMTESVFEQMRPPEQQAWLQKRYSAGHHSSERKTQIALARAWPIPPQFYRDVCSYADRHDCSAAQKQYFRQLDAARAQRAYAERHGLGDLLERQDLDVLSLTGRYPIQCYSKTDLFVDRDDLTESQKDYFREAAPMNAWSIIVRGVEPGFHTPADDEKSHEESTERRQKVFHKKTIVGHVLSILRVTRLDPSEEARLKRSPEHKELRRLTWDFSFPAYESPGDISFRKAAAEEALRRADDPDAPHQYLAAAAGQKYYCLPSEPASWRRPVHGPSRDYDPVWEKMFCNADMRSMVWAELLEYTGKRGDDGWIRPTLWELFKMDFWTAHRYAFYYAEFAEEYGRKIPLWIALILRSRQAYAPSYTPSEVMFSECTPQARIYATTST